MAEERTLGLARAGAPEQSTEELSKEQLQRRMDLARDSISHTVTEIKETVANQVQAVKDTLDWREQFKKRPVAWSVGAFGVGLLVGVGVAALVKGDEDEEPNYYGQDYRAYAAQPILSSSSPALKAQAAKGQTEGNGHDEDTGPGFFERLTHSQAYERVKDEVSSVGDNLIQELTKTAKVMVVPAIMSSLRKFLGEYLPAGSTSGESASRGSAQREPNNSWSRDDSSYQPALERS